LPNISEILELPDTQGLLFSSAAKATGLSLHFAGGAFEWVAAGATDSARSCVEFLACFDVVFAVHILFWGKIRKTGEF